MDTTIAVTPPPFKVPRLDAYFADDELHVLHDNAPKKENRGSPRGLK
jgi:hypothetical protein